MKEQVGGRGITIVPRFSGNGSGLLRQSLEPKFLATNALLAGAYFVAGRLGLLFAIVNVSASPVWPASGIAFAGLLLLGRRGWPGVFIGALLVNVTTSGRFLPSLAIAAGNTLEGVLGAYLVDRFNNGRRGFDRAGDVGRFFVLAGAISTTIAATIGTMSLRLGGLVGAADSGAVWLTWWLGDAVGVLVVAPVILLWAADFEVQWPRRKILEAIMLGIAIVVIGRVLFGGWLPQRLEHYPLDFLCIPVFVWVAFRFGQREAATAVAILSGIALAGTLDGFGPFVSNSPSDSLLLLEGFLGLTAVMTLAFAAVLAENRRGQDAILRMATIVIFSNDAIITKSLDGTISSWNPAAQRLFGYAAEEAIGRNISLIVPHEHRHEEDMILGKIRRGERVDHLETVRTRKDGASIYVELTISPVKSSEDVIVGASTIVRDVSDRMSIELQRNALLVREQEARAAAETGNRSKDEFLAVLSHELRTPLNAVYGWARMLQLGKLDEETSTRALDAIVRNANMQVQLIDDLLDVSRVMNGKMRLDIRPVELQEVVERALDAVRPVALAKGVRLESDLDPRGGKINGDEGRLQQIVWNLVTNSVKFTDAGGLVQVRLRHVNGSMEIVVRDTGQGIPAHVLPFVFDRFRQWDSSSTRAHSGLGLGLALVKHLTELHRGTVSAESDGLGKGATFRVTFPPAVATPLVSSPPEVRADVAPPTQVRLEGVRIVTVDDDPDALALAAAILSNAGAQVRTCRSAAEAFAVFREWRPDVLVSDIEMPGEDGYSLIRRVRALDEESGARTPAVALTAYGRMEDRMRTLAAGYSMHVPKPLDPDEFTAIIASVARILRRP